jgi:hypothetical protein
MPDARPDYTDRQPRPECLNSLTSLAADTLCSSCAALLNARQTAILVTAGDRLNVYLVARSTRTRQRCYENRLERRGAVTDSAVSR